jgi:hypothetical protein
MTSRGVRRAGIPAPSTSVPDRNCGVSVDVTLLASDPTGIRPLTTGGLRDKGGRKLDEHIGEVLAASGVAGGTSLAALRLGCLIAAGRMWREFLAVGGCRRQCRGAIRLPAHGLFLGAGVFVLERLDVRPVRTS